LIFEKISVTYNHQEEETATPDNNTLDNLYTLPIDTMKTITVYTRNYPYRKYNGEWGQLQTKYLFNPERDHEEFTQKNYDDLYDVAIVKYSEEYE
jgi:hypothetical protein